LPTVSENIDFVNLTRGVYAGIISYMQKNSEFEQLGLIFKASRPVKKPPKYEWQDLALRVINELGIPNFKRNSVFKICKDYDKEFVERCLNDTKELCKTGETWKYFFKVAAQSK